MATKQQSIIDAITTLVQATPGIVSATPWKPTPFKPTDCPGVYIADPRAEIEFIDNEQQAVNLEIMLLIFTAGGTSGASVLNLISAIYTKLKSDETLGGLIWTMSPVFHEIDLNQTGAIIAAAQMSLRLTYDSSRWGV